jgi:hypothetical protein
VAVRAQELEVLEAVVAVAPVDVVKGERERLAEPILDAAPFTAWRLEPVGKKAAPQVPAASPVLPNDQQLLDRRRSRAGDDCASSACGVPRFAGETEFLLALSDGMPRVVERWISAQSYRRVKRGSAGRPSVRAW